MDDDFVELEECFVVAISLPPESAELGVSITDGNDMALCCIQDNDRKSSCVYNTVIEGCEHRKPETA